MTAATRADTSSTSARPSPTPRRRGGSIAATLAAMLVLTIVSTAPIWQRILRGDDGPLHVG
jgi:hypothetical protein